jgi:hypothetical protein
VKPARRPGHVSAGRSEARKKDSTKRRLNLRSWAFINLRVLNSAHEPWRRGMKAGRQPGCLT